LVQQVDLNHWKALVKPGKKARPGTHLLFAEGILEGEVEEVVEEGMRLIRFDYEGNFMEILDRLGTMPLPPYIHEQLKDQSRYQCVYAKDPGSAAAPTAGLHFTEELLDKIRAKGVTVAEVLLNVGLGTFRPVKVENIEEHQMHSEYYSVDEETAALINECRKNGGRVVSVGTTSTRTLETVSTEDGIVHAGSGWTQKFIYPGYHYKAVDSLITNFHLPGSTLMMLVSAFATREMIMQAYETAVAEEYRFFSFGDAMLIL
jgi:S-adenosylmethionine:tRNA ribosyltransferase-isomerase